MVWVSAMQGNEAFFGIARTGILKRSKVAFFGWRGVALCCLVWLFRFTALVHRVFGNGSIWLSVLRQPAVQLALQCGGWSSLNRAVRPAAVSSPLVAIARLQIVWHSLCQFAFWRFAKGIETRRTSLQPREFSLQGFFNQAVPSSNARWPNGSFNLHSLRSSDSHPCGCLPG
jgi:hypothetical protein